jgi:hypothetical protein
MNSASAEHCLQLPPPHHLEELSANAYLVRLDDDAVRLREMMSEAPAFTPASP